MEHIERAFGAQFARFNRAVNDVARNSVRFHELKLDEPANALFGFISAMASPNEFVPKPFDGPATPEPTTTQRFMESVRGLLKRPTPKPQAWTEDGAILEAYSVFLGMPCAVPITPDIASLATVAQVAQRARKDNPILTERDVQMRDMVGTPLLDILQERIRTHQVNAIPGVPPEAIAELYYATHDCVMAALEFRLVGTFMPPDFRNLAAHTVEHIIASGVVARVNGNGILSSTRGLERLLERGLLPLGNQQEQDGVNVWVYRLYKVDASRQPGTGSTTLHTAYFAPPKAPPPEPEMRSPDGTMIGIKRDERYAPLPREALITDMQALATARGIPPERLNDALRFWESFARMHLENDQRFQFRNLNETYLLTTVSSLVGMPVAEVQAYTVPIGTANIGEMIKRNVAGDVWQQFIGDPLWHRPVRDEGRQRHWNEIRKTVVDNLADKLSTNLTWCEIHPQMMNPICGTVVEAFALFFEAAFTNDLEAERKFAQVVRCYLLGFVPLGIIKGRNGQPAVTVVCLG